jgi:type VI protein secretion system component VasK
VIPQKTDLVDGFIFTVNGEQTPLKGGDKKALIWPGAGMPSFRFSLRRRGSSEPEDINTYDGTWAVFRFFANAEKITQGGNGVTFGWLLRTGRDAQVVTVGGKQVSYDILVDTNGGPAIFSKDFLSTLKCVGPLR